MSLEEQMKSGDLYWEYGNPSQTDQAYEKVIEGQRQQVKELVFDFNHTRPSQLAEKSRLLQQIFGNVAGQAWVESPLHASYGVNTRVGHDFYANFNLVLVDDGPITIGDQVMLAPNVTITTTGHPIHPAFRVGGGQFSLPVVIEDGVWIGANVVVMPGVTIGKNTVIGAGSVVTKDIPANVVAFGSPCQVIREINERDQVYYHGERKISEGALRRLTEPTN